MIRFLVAVVTLLLLPASKAGEELLDDRYAPLLNAEDQVITDMIEIAIREAMFDNAIDLSARLLSNVKASNSIPGDQTGYSPDTIGRVMVNHGIIYFTADRYDEAILNIDEGLQLIESQHKYFSESLVPGLTAKGTVEMALKRYAEAEDTFHRAQHIIHREKGVTSEEQLELVQRLVSSKLWRDRDSEADNLQLFSLHIAEKTWGPNALELIPMLQQLGFYFAARSYNTPAVQVDDDQPQKDLLFRRSLSMYKRSIEIIETAYGPDDIRLLQPLRGLGSVRMRNLTSRNLAKEAYERAHQIIDGHPGSDDADRAKALVDLGDLHTVLRDGEIARDYYLQAWTLLQQSEPMRAISDATFGAPRQLHPARKEVIRLDRKPDAAEPGVALFATLSYRVEADGRVRKIQVIERNVPNSHVRMLRQLLSGTYFRPRIADGDVVATDNLMLYQRFLAPQNSSNEVKTDVQGGADSNDGSDTSEPAQRRPSQSAPESPVGETPTSQPPGDRETAPVN